MWVKEVSPRIDFGPDGGCLKEEETRTRPDLAQVGWAVAPFAAIGPGTPSRSILTAKRARRHRPRPRPAPRP
jgi:hypothetical protein